MGKPLYTIQLYYAVGLFVHQKGFLLEIKVALFYTRDICYGTFKCYCYCDHFGLKISTNTLYLGKCLLKLTLYWISVFFYMDFKE